MALMLVMLGANASGMLLTDSFDRADTKYSTDASVVGASWVNSDLSDRVKVSESNLFINAGVAPGILYNKAMETISDNGSGFAVHADVWTKNGTWCGLVFNYQNTTNYYVLRMRGNSRCYQLLRVVNGSEQVIVNKSDASKTFSAETFYTLNVSSDMEYLFDFSIKEVSGTAILNPTAACRDAHSSFTGGYAGLYCAQTRSNPDGKFNNFGVEVLLEKPLSGVDIKDINGSAFVYYNGKEIVEFRENRRLRFRANPESTLWIGCMRKPMDLCWAFNEPGVNDYVVQDVKYENDEGHFAVIVEALKPSVSGMVTNRLDGDWENDTKKFNYRLTSSLHCPLDLWYQNSSAAMSVYEKTPEGRPGIEATDYHIEDISVTDILQSPNPDHPELYDWLLSSQSGTQWTLFPKIHIPFPIRPGSYPTINYSRDQVLGQGGYFGFIDLEEGGWMSRIIETPVPISYGLCWMFFDVHILMRNAIPPRYSQENLSLQYKLQFTPVEPAEVPGIMAKASEVEWRSLTEYQLPVLSRTNQFDRLISGKDSEFMWWASSYDCSRDMETGKGDHYSVTINQTENKSAAWYAGCLGFPYDKEVLSGKYQITADVKTDHCSGSVRLGVAHTKHDYWIHSDRAVPSDVEWVYSDELTGTTNWTQRSLTFTAYSDGRRNLIVLEQTGSGQSWFDNVVIKKIE